jgi:hypothetical protein
VLQLAAALNCCRLIARSMLPGIIMWRLELTRGDGLGYYLRPRTIDAEVAELADARDSKSRAPCGHEGSTPSFGTNKNGDIILISRRSIEIQSTRVK